jgi:Proliferating cell nuclear antigen, C-terminal domain
MTKDLVDVVTDNISILKGIFTMLEEITEDDINIIFKKSPEMEKKNKNNQSDSDSSDDKSSDDSDDSDDSDNSDNSDDSDDNSDNDSDNKTKYNKQKKSKNHVSGGITIQAITGHQTLVAMVKVYASSFTKYFIKDDEFSCWVNITELNKCLKDIEITNYELNMKVKGNDNNTLHLIINHKENETRQEIYPIVFVENDTDIPRIPDVNFDLQVDISTSLFKKICTKAKKFDDTMKISCNSDQIIFEYKTGAKKPIYICYGSDDPEVKIKRVTTKKDPETEEKYILNDLLCLKNATGISDTMTLYLRNKTPLFINYKISSNNDNEISQMLIFMSPNDDYDFRQYHAINDKLLKDKKAVMK